MEKKLWHAMPYEEVLREFEVSEEGLKSAEVAQRLERYGLNKLQEEKKKSAFVRFMMQFSNLLIYVLLAAAVVTALLEHFMDSVVILSVVLINAIIGFMQENRAQNAMDAIKKMLAFSATVQREGKKTKISSEELVPGDIVYLGAGDRVLADIRLIQAHGFSVQEALLTGESVPVEKHLKAVEEDATIGDRSSMAFAGTTVAGGQAKGVVVATANHTELGAINKMLGEVQTLTTPLLEQMDKFAKWLTGVILTVSALIFLFGYFVKSMHFNEIFMAVVGLFVAAIPEGLPAVLTITLAVGVQAMARRNAIVRHLPAIETIGAVSVICSDKTGTLTQNEMTVVSFVSREGEFTIEGSGYEPLGEVLLQGEKIAAKEYASLHHLGKCALLCNDAQLHNEEGAWKVEGSPTEGALVAFGRKIGFDAQELRESFSRDDMIPFDSKHKFMATLNHNHIGESMIIVKGAPEVIVKMCALEYKSGGEATAIESAFWEEQARFIASEGQRVLALAYKKVEGEKKTLTFEDLKSELVLIGLVGLIDPPRPEAIEAIKECRSASIDVKMITGDHALTAAAIGRTIGLKNTQNPLTGAEIEKLNDEELQQAVLSTDVFARTTPEHKLRLVSALQAQAKIVAMTGDGVNDAPALKRANAGVAMGKNGTEAAKESSEFVLTDDNFASIVSAVREGRRVFDNIKKVISWTLPTNASEASVVIVAILLGMAMPISPIQILWANMITAVTLGIALAFEGEDNNIMQRAPRGIDEPILNGVLVWQILFVTALFVTAIFGIYYISVEEDPSIEHAQTLALNTLVFMEIFYLFYIRNHNTIKVGMRDMLGTKVVWTAVGVVFFAQLAITYVPFMQSVFKTAPLSLYDFGLILGAGVAMLVILEVEKQFRLRRGKIKG